MSSGALSSKNLFNPLIMPRSYRGFWTFSKNESSLADGEYLGADIVGRMVAVVAGGVTAARVFSSQFSWIQIPDPRFQMTDPEGGNGLGQLFTYIRGDRTPHQEIPSRGVG